MVQLATFLTTLAAAISTVSAVCVCTPGVNYCGYELLGGEHGCLASDLNPSVGQNMWQSLYKCNAGGRNASYLNFCSLGCQPRQYGMGDCDGTNSCCGVPVVGGQ